MGGIKILSQDICGGLDQLPLHYVCSARRMRLVTSYMHAVQISTKKEARFFLRGHGNAMHHQPDKRISLC